MRVFILAALVVAAWCMGAAAQMQDWRSALDAVKDPDESRAATASRALESDILAMQGSRSPGAAPAIEAVARLWMDEAPDDADLVLRPLCRVKPFTLGTPEEDGVFSKNLLDTFAASWTKQAVVDQEAYQTAAYTDCAASNLESGYFGQRPRLEKIAPFGACEGRQYYDLRSVIEPWIRDAQQARDWLADAPSGYLAKLDLMISSMRIYRAATSAGSDFGVLRDVLAEEGARLLDIGQEGALLKRRNGWRVRNDMLITGAVYALASATPELRERATDVLKGLASEEPLLESGLDGWIDPKALQGIQSETDYRDPVFVGRFFPALLADPVEDCRRNLGRSLEQTDMARRVLDCIGETPPATRDELAAYDACLAGAESAAWGAQFGAYKDEGSARAALSYLTSLNSAHALNIEIVAPDASSTFFRLRTNEFNDFRDVERFVEDVSAADFPAMAFRKKIY